MEISFAQNVVEKRHVVVVVSVFGLSLSIFLYDIIVVSSCLQKYLDVFASSFGFFLIGFDAISDYSSPQGKSHQFFQITDPILWFFKVFVVCVQNMFHLLSYFLGVQFTFASNAATIIGGCLVTNKYKLRLPAAFISAFVISVSYYTTHTHEDCVVRLPMW